MDAAWAELARKVADEFAPVIYQDLADGLFNDDNLRRRDMLTTVDYDGTLDPADNSEHIDDYPHPGAVYYDAVETETHWYLLYSLYHVVDWDEFGFIDHESDMEHVWLVVEKQVDGELVPIALHTQAHGETFAWTELTGNFPAESEPIALDGTHPQIFIESHGHGPAMCGFSGGLPFTQAIDCSPPSTEDLVVYSVQPDATPEALTEPDSSDDNTQTAAYALVWAYESLWPVRGEIADNGGNPPMWDDPFEYIPGRNADYDDTNDYSVSEQTWGADYSGDEGGGGGVPPWGYFVHDDYTGGKYYGAQGDWLLDPAALFSVMYRNYSCSDREAFFNYLGNPYLSETATAQTWSGTDEGRRCGGTLFPEPTEDSGDTGGSTTDSGSDTGGADTGEADTVPTDSAGDTGLIRERAGQCGCQTGASPAWAGLLAAAACRRKIKGKR